MTMKRPDGAGNEKRPSSSASTTGEPTTFGPVERCALGIGWRVAASMTRPVSMVVTGRLGAAESGGGGGAGACPDSVASDVTRTATTPKFLMAVVDIARYLNGPLASCSDFLHDQPSSNPPG